MKLINKIRSRRGETLVEMLVSITLLVLAMSILAAMLSAAYNSDVSARKMDDKLREELSAVEEGTSPPSSGKVSIYSIKPDGKPDESAPDVQIDVDVYGGAGALRIYKPKPTP